MQEQKIFCIYLSMCKIPVFDGPNVYKSFFD